MRGFTLLSFTCKTCNVLRAVTSAGDLTQRGINCIYLPSDRSFIMKKKRLHAFQISLPTRKL